MSNPFATKVYVVLEDWMKLPDGLHRACFSRQDAEALATAWNDDQPMTMRQEFHVEEWLLTRATTEVQDQVRELTEVALKSIFAEKQAQLVRETLRDCVTMVQHFFPRRFDEERWLRKEHPQMSFFTKEQWELMESILSVDTGRQRVRTPAPPKI